MMLIPMTGSLLRESSFRKRREVEGNALLCLMISSPEVFLSGLEMLARSAYDSKSALDLTSRISKVEVGIDCILVRFKA